MKVNIFFGCIVHLWINPCFDWHQTINLLYVWLCKVCTSRISCSVLFSHAIIYVLLCFYTTGWSGNRNFNFHSVSSEHFSFFNYEMNKSIPPTCSSNSSGHHYGGSSDKDALYEPVRSAILTGLSHNSVNAGKEWKSCSYSASLVICKACYSLWILL